MPLFIQPSCLPLPLFQAEWPHFQWFGDQNSSVERLLQQLAMTGERGRGTEGFVWDFLGELDPESQLPAGAGRCWLRKTHNFSALPPRKRWGWHQAVLQALNETPSQLLFLHIYKLRPRSSITELIHPSDCTAAQIALSPYVVAKRGLKNGWVFPPRLSRSKEKRWLTLQHHEPPEPGTSPGGWDKLSFQKVIKPQRASVRPECAPSYLARL